MTKHELANGFLAGSPPFGDLVIRISSFRSATVLASRIDYEHEQEHD
jgi:hypothetical protein